VDSAVGSLPWRGRLGPHLSGRPGQARQEGALAPPPDCRAASARQVGRVVYLGSKNILNQEHLGNVERIESAQVIARLEFNPGFITDFEKLSSGAASTSAPLHVLATYKPLSWSSGTTSERNSSDAIHFLR